LLKEKTIEYSVLGHSEIIKDMIKQRGEGAVIDGEDERAAIISKKCLEQWRYTSRSRIEIGLTTDKKSEHPNHTDYISVVHNMG